tara:strand:- start:257 stop:502 length:246 start_codon:yes stop_codon:yes gene_type:complete
MFKAMLLICTLYPVSGTNENCWEIHDMIAPNGYITEEQCMVRIDEMADAVRSIVPAPYKIQYKCDKTMERTHNEIRNKETS